MLYAIGRNVNKYSRFLHEVIRKFEGKMDQKTALKKECFEIWFQGVLCPKISSIGKRKKILWKIKCKNTGFHGIFLFFVQEFKNR